MLTKEQVIEMTNKYQGTKTNLEEDGFHLIGIKVNEIGVGLVPCYTLWNIERNLPHTKYLDGNQCVALLIQKGFSFVNAANYMDEALTNTSTGNTTFAELVENCEFSMDVIVEIFKSSNKFKS